MESMAFEPPATMLDEQYPIFDLDTPLKGIQMLYNVDYWLSRFVYETRKTDSQPYPPTSLRNICCGIQCILNDNCERGISMRLVNKDDATFRLFQQALEKRAKELLRDGIGVDIQHKDPVTPDDEMILWESGTFNMHTALGLSCCAYFYNCKVFGLRAMDKHVDLKAEQFTLGVDDKNRKFVQFQGRLAKNVTGDIDSRGKPKKIRQYSDPSNPRCIVGILQAYLNAIHSQ